MFVRACPSVSPFKVKLSTLLSLLIASLFNERRRRENAASAKGARTQRAPKAREHTTDEWGDSHEKKRAPKAQDTRRTNTTHHIRTAGGETFNRTFSLATTVGAILLCTQRCSLRIRIIASERSFTPVSLRAQTQYNANVGGKRMACIQIACDNHRQPGRGHT